MYDDPNHGEEIDTQYVWWSPNHGEEIDTQLVCMMIS